MLFYRPLSLLLETLTDGNPEIVIYCVATLANIAMNVDNHMQVIICFYLKIDVRFLAFVKTTLHYSVNCTAAKNGCCTSIFKLLFLIKTTPSRLVHVENNMYVTTLAV